ncbi:MAG: hypothetical protein JNG84_02760, partial [Archangium sp.]|nr:hypothetical protein [Archangium sp.]
AFADHLELRLAADWNRYFITLRPDEGATLFARGAADQSLGGSVTVMWVM